jgi:hypothetical protein
MDGATWAAWIAVVVAAVAIVVSIGIARWQLTRKVLAFEAYTEFPLFAGGQLAKQIEVRANGTRLTLPHLLLVTVTNTGNAAIRPEDFYDGINITLNDADLVALHIDPSPGVGVASSLDDPQTVKIEPLLLNTGEGFVCYGLVEGCPHGVQVTTRVADGEVRDMSRTSVSETLLEGALAVAVGGLGAVLGSLIGTKAAGAVTSMTPTRRVRASNTVAPPTDKR